MHHDLVVRYFVDAAADCLAARPLGNTHGFDRIGPADLQHHCLQPPPLHSAVGCCCMAAVLVVDRSWVDVSASL